MVFGFKRKPFSGNEGRFFELLTLQAGKTYVWCLCGEARTQPFCDGAHTKTSFKPLVFKATTTGEVLVCQCKRTKNPPYCDGTHKTL